MHVTRENETIPSGPEKAAPGLMTAPQRIMLLVLQSIILLLVIGGLTLYAMSVNDQDRLAMLNRIRHAELLSRNLEKSETGENKALDTLHASLLEVAKTVGAQQSRADIFRKTLVTVILAGIAIVACMSYLIVKGIARRYPEIREER